MRTASSLLLTMLILCAAGAALLSPTPACADKDEWKAPAEAAQVKNPVEPTKESVARGEATYKISCLDCHGPQGRGDGKQAKGLSKKPADLAAELHEYPDGDIFWKISEGKRPMPSFKKYMKPEERWDIVNYLRKVIQAPAKDAPADTTKSEPDPKTGSKEEK